MLRYHCIGFWNLAKFFFLYFAFFVLPISCRSSSSDEAELIRKLENSVISEWKHHEKKSGLFKRSFSTSRYQKHDSNLTVYVDPFGPVEGIYMSPKHISPWNLRRIPKFAKTKWPRAFLGIPFAEKPLGKRRFRMPERWSETWMQAFGDPVLKADRFGPQCAQILAIPPKAISEDCLYLNVFTPPADRILGLNDIKTRRLRNGDFVSVPKRKLPVMFWIFGGAWEFGSGGVGSTSTLNPYVGSYVTAHKDVIIVTFNHRVGPFGFMPTAGESLYDADGNKAVNHGLEDIRAAYSWTVEHIEEFGGDPDQITTFGLSSGGYNSILLALDLKSHPVRRVISMSPPVTLKPRTLKQSLQISDQIFKLLRCADADCVRKKSTLRILTASMLVRDGWLENYLSDSLKWLPVYDNDMVPARPLDMFTQPSRILRRRIANIDWMFGSGKDEADFYLVIAEGFGLLKGGAFFMLRGNQSIVDYFTMKKRGQYANYLARGLFEEPLTKHGQRFVLSVDRLFGPDEEVIREIIQKYVPKKTNNENVRTFNNLLTDYLFTCPVRNMARNTRRFSRKSYLYRLTHSPLWTKSLFGRTTSHAVDAVFFWNYVPTLPKHDLYISQLYTDYWTSFASGNINDVAIPTRLYDPPSDEHEYPPNQRTILYELKLLYNFLRPSKKIAQAAAEYTTRNRDLVYDTEMPIWPRYDKAGQTMLLGSPTHGASVSIDVRGEFCEFWDRIRKPSKLNQQYPF